MATKRIEFIDAMRGFTMLLVVYGHIIFFSYSDSFSADFALGGGKLLSFSSLTNAMQMPLFFFISGFILYKNDFEWTLPASGKFLLKKAKVLLIPALFFFTVFLYIFDGSFIDYLFHPAKAGYWFTIALFEYFVLYVILRIICHKFGYKNGIDWLILTVSAIIFIFSTVSVLSTLGLYDKPVIGLLGVEQLIYFIFFIIGTLAKKHFDKIKMLADKGWVVAICLLFFFGFEIYNLHEQTTNIVMSACYQLNRAIGLMLVFVFFMKNENLFTQETRFGRVLQYVGRRTLDIYLLHYFFLPRNLEVVGKFFSTYQNPSLELFVTLALAIAVVTLSLLMSKIIRMSPLLADWLLGVKKKA